MNGDTSQYNTARDFLKILAIIAMTADHASTVFLNEGNDLYSICQFFGNFTIVIMCFFITQGLRYTRSIQKYAARLLLWAAISEIPFYLLFGLQLNVLCIWRPKRDRCALTGGQLGGDWRTAKTEM